MNAAASSSGSTRLSHMSNAFVSRVKDERHEASLTYHGSNSVSDVSRPRNGAVDSSTAVLRMLILSSLIGVDPVVSVSNPSIVHSP